MGSILREVHQDLQEIFGFNYIEVSEAVFTKHVRRLSAVEGLDFLHTSANGLHYEFTMPDLRVR